MKRIPHEDCGIYGEFSQYLVLPGRAEKTIISLFDNFVRDVTATQRADKMKRACDDYQHGEFSTSSRFPRQRRDKKHSEEGPADYS